MTMRELWPGTTRDRSWYLLLLDDLAQWPASTPFAGQRFSLLLVVDEDDGRRGFPGFGAFVDRAIDQGLAYFCAWGPACAELEDRMDEDLVTRVIDGGEEAAFTMTTSHTDERLEEALEFVRDFALDGEIQDVDTAPGVVCLVRRPDLVAQVEAFRSA